MTAEVAILNREAVAMAADSAATVSDGTGQKIFSSAHKIFALSKHHPVGIMIYGNALFMDIPWEVIIKVYRRNLGDNRFNTLNEYARNFIEFLKGDLKLFPPSQQEKYVASCVFPYFGSMRMEIEEKAEELLNEQGELSDEDVSEIIDVIVGEALAAWKNGFSNILNKETHRKQIKTVYRELFAAARANVFEDLPISTRSATRLIEIASYLPVTFPEGIEKQDTAGIVISGFGEDEIFPSIVSYTVEGIANNVLKYKELVNESIGFEKTALIYPFAQREMVITFIDGISPLFQELYSDLLVQSILNYPEIIIDAVVPTLEEKKKEKMLEQIEKVGISNLELGLQRIHEIQREKFVDPILKVVTFLAKNELAEMAESLVNLTCLRKKISMDDETVGGPVDVAVISKGDGLIWIRRKQYFERELNPDFFNRLRTS